MSGKTARHIRSFPPEAERASPRALLTVLADRAAASALDGWVFFDRGLIDAAGNLQFLTCEPVLATPGQSHRYHRRVFLTPPWPEIYSTDPERRHSLGKELAESRLLLEGYPSLGYEVCIVPRIGASERTDFVLNALAE
jgi:predicted ATPase